MRKIWIKHRFKMIKFLEYLVKLRYLNFEQVSNHDVAVMENYF